MKRSNLLLIAYVCLAGKEGGLTLYRLYHEILILFELLGPVDSVDRDYPLLGFEIYASFNEARGSLFGREHLLVVAFDFFELSTVHRDVPEFFT